MKRIIIALIIVACTGVFSLNASAQGTIEVTGTASVSITPDRITVEIAVEEFYRKSSATDSVKVDIASLEKDVRRALKKSGVPDSLVKLSDIGNYYYPYRSRDFLMGMRFSAVLTEMQQLIDLSNNLDFPGITSFRITETSNSEMEKYNRRGLKAALDKAREKAEFMVASEGFSPRLLVMEIKEEGPLYYDEATTANVMLQAESFDDADTGGRLLAKAVPTSSMTMDNMKKIVRRYSVWVKYGFSYH